ncbi:MAG TPA: S41 family peptidase [Vicinamibacterales bacterium]|nr:S41 family peptidase [Vicinamibacterales bacterium]
MSPAIRQVAGPLAVLVSLASGALVPAQVHKGLETFDAVWTIVRDSHFDPALNGVDWGAVREELRPGAASATTDGELRSVIREMLGRLGQSHFALVPSTADTPLESGDTSGDPGFDVRLIGREVIVISTDRGGSAAAAGVRPGWRLTAIDARLVSSMLDALPDGMADRLLHVEGWRIVTSRLRGPRGSSVPLTFEDGSGREMRVQVQRRAEQGEPATVGHMPTMFVQVESGTRRTPAGAAVGLVRFNVWMPAVDARFAEAIDRFRALPGIVLDLRGNPGGLAAMIMGISGHFLTERKPLGVMKTRDSELRFFSNPRLVNAAGQRVKPFGGRLAILMDGMSGSASECFAGGLQSLGRARVFGQTSMGQALPALFDLLPNGDVFIHAYGDFVTATGVRLEGRGVIPDEAVPLRRADLLAGRDVTLERALAWIDRQDGG